MRIRLAMGLSVAVACGGSEPTVPLACVTGLPAEVAAAIPAVLASHSDVNGLVVGIWTPTHGLRIEAFGMNDAGADEPMTVDRVFEIGSIQKSFQAVLLHRLDEQGVLSVDALVNDYVSAPVLPATRLTHVMQHSAGLLEHHETGYLSEALANPTREFSYAEMMAFLDAAGTTHDGFEVGVDFHYATFGTLILGQIAATAAGSTIDALYHDRLFEPLGLEDTSIVYYEPRPARLATGYLSATEVFTATASYENTASVSSGVGKLLYSTGCDLLRFSRGVASSPDFISPARRARILSETVAYHDAIAGQGDLGLYGLGMYTWTAWGDLWGHAGSGIHGHSTAYAQRPDGSLHVVVMTNLDSTVSAFAIHADVFALIDDML